jgi:hypothetical protein
MQIEFQAGATVRARGGRFIVLSADTIAQGGNDPIRRLRLRALEEPFRNEEICVLHPIENVEPDEIPELDILRPRVPQKVRSALVQRGALIADARRWR